MRPRIATYRLQFRNGMDFDGAAEVVPYLARLGVSHLYASPIFRATAGSTHGYDVADHGEFDPSLGGRAGFERLSEALRRHGLGLMLDIVPNHMAASPENPWWRDAAEWGARARHARHFDIDWREPLTLPFLGEPFDDVLAAGDLALRADDAGRGLTLAYHEHAYPLAPESYAMLADADGEPALAELAAVAGRAAPEAAEDFHAGMRRALAAADGEALHGALGRLSENHDLLARLHEAQNWRLMHWREGRRHLSYRRFFEITGLAGVRVEDPAVFDDVHRLTLELVREGVVDGLRVDHVDGMRDPKGYLQRLRAEAGPETWIVVEKILEGSERLPADWPVEGATGYEFIAAMADLFVPPEGAVALDEAYSALGASPAADNRRTLAKRRVLTYNFEGELEQLTDLCAEEAPDAPREELREALAGLIVGLPVYRTYGDADGFGEADRKRLEEAQAVAADTADGVLAARLVEVMGRPGEVEARARFQQLTGPVMAKAVEDTLFYRHNALLALNEVGCDPVAPPAGPEAVRRALIERRGRHPEGLNATATHDTKRGEDGRARLYMLAQAPERWTAASARWRLAAGEAAGAEPSAAMVWTVHQALAGVWPQSDAPPEGAALDDLRERFTAYLVKAMREAKLRTSWTAQDPDYEAAATAYAEALLAPDARDFQMDFHAALRPFAEAGRVASLAQTLLKLTAPGAPDIYQGAEAEDFSLVDPDNRRPVDFDRLARALEVQPAPGDLGAEKQTLIAAALAERRRRPELFAAGGFEPLEVAGPRAADLFAWMRADGQGRCLSVAPIRPMLDAAWDGTVVRLPAEGPALNDLMDPSRTFEGRELPADRLFARWPVALLSG